MLPGSRCRRLMEYLPWGIELSDVVEKKVDHYGVMFVASQCEQKKIFHYHGFAHLGHDLCCKHLKVCGVNLCGMCNRFTNKRRVLALMN